MNLFPSSADVQLEFDKVKLLLVNHCQSNHARKLAADLIIHTEIGHVELALRQTNEYRILTAADIYFPNDHILNLEKELKILGIPGAVLAGEQLTELRKLAENTEKIFRWFDAERKAAYPSLARLIASTYYEKAIRGMIDPVIDESGQVKDNASPELKNIRGELYRKRNELRRLFDRIVARLNKQGFLAEIEESFMNGRKVLAVVAEQKKTVRGILHGESDSGRTAFLEPEETIEPNNRITSLESEEKSEVYRILRELTGKLAPYADLLGSWHSMVGEFDFINAKARLAIQMKGEFVTVTDRSKVHLIDAVHPLLYLHNLRAKKTTIPVSVTLDENQRILVISGPNAGGKTVALKTVGLLQLMVQSGLLIPVNPSSEVGIFKQLMIHIGDTQSIEFELSTYSSHLLHMKHFMEHANGRTLFFIDELGSGTDPNLGGAFAEVILQELLKKHAMGIVTTHYLNLKIMAGKTSGIVNGAMAFDEINLQPLYKLLTGKPGSSYTFSIAERIGIDHHLIERARALVDEDQYRLDRLLNNIEQELQGVERDKKELQRQLKENGQLKKEMQQLMDSEKHRQQVELLKHQNKTGTERLTQLRDMERKMKQLLVTWRKEENKNKVMREMEALLFRKNEKTVVNKLRQKIDSKYEEIEGEIKPGVTVMMRLNHQVGKVMELRGKRAVVKVGTLQMQVGLDQLVIVKEKERKE